MAKKLGQQDDLLALALGRGLSIAAAAREVGMSDRTARRRASDPDFKLRVQHVRDELLSQATGRLSEAALAAIEQLATLLGAYSASVRLGAARAILESVCRFREQHDLAARLAALEETSHG